MAISRFKITYRPGIRMIITLVCVLGILGGSGFSIYNALRTLYESSLKDAWTILFLDLETRSQSISNHLPFFVDKLKRQEPIAQFAVVDPRSVRWIKGEFQWVKSLETIGVDYLAIEKGSKDVSFGQINGILFAAVRVVEAGLDQLNLYEMDATDFGKVFSLNTKYTTVYVANRSGMLLFANSNAVTPDNFAKRPLVSSFIKMPFKQGQSEFEFGGDSLYGFYQEIPKSNMVLFAEKTKHRAMEAVYSTIRRVSGVSILYLSLAVLLLQIPLWLATRPIRALTEMASKLAKGDFNVKLSAEGFGELGELSRTFVDMTENLQKRDKMIASLHIEKLEKTKMEQGIRVASTIQERFLFKPDPDQSAWVQIAAKYEPSLHLAGDWYGVHRDKLRGETIISIVDITGHGIESSMMTPVMSVLFQEQMSRTEDKAFDIREFMERCNSALYAYGAGISTATGIIAKFNENEKTVTWLNAGHPAPVIVGADGSMTKAKGASGSGTILGFGPTLDMTEQRSELASGSILALFSDGLMTAPVGGATGFSRKDLFNTLKTSKRFDVNSVLSAVMDVWRKKNASVRIEDDMCLVLGLIK